MRKVTKSVCEAFINGKKKSAGNTRTDGEALFLHGNKIAERREDGIYATFAGWPTVTTRERLNGLCELLGLGRPFRQRRYNQHFKNKPILSSDWIKLS